MLIPHALPLFLHTQGELAKKGTYPVVYRNVLHAAWTIARTEGVLALQKGLGPALVYQFTMNGVRLGYVGKQCMRGVRGVGC